MDALEYYKAEFEAYKSKIESIMREVYEADSEGRDFIHKELIVSIVTGDSREG